MLRKSARFGKSLGFTLIELLIVVAIISILAAIAIPNYLEAQVRAKVAASVSNLRTVAMAMEVYRTDEYNYPPWYMVWGEEYCKIPYTLLTSPVAYLGSFEAMVDPFEMHQGNVGYHWYRTAGVGGFYWHEGNLAEDDCDFTFRGNEMRAAGIAIPKACPYALFGAGPMTVVLTTFETMNIYDSSNGTVSWGTIWRFGP